MAEYKPGFYLDRFKSPLLRYDDGSWYQFDEHDAWDTDMDMERHADLPLARIIQVD